MAEDSLRENIVNAYIKDYFANEGRIRRQVSFKSDSVITLEFPYAQTEVSIKPSSSFRGRIYFSVDGVKWFFRGEVSQGRSEVVFPITGAEGQPFVFRYFVKFLDKEDDAGQYTAEISTKFTFSEIVFFNNPAKSLTS